MSSGSEPDGDFGGDVESYDSQREEEIEIENEREGNQKRQLSGDESEENNYQPEKKKHKSGKSSKKKDKKQRLEKGKLIADIRNFEDLDVDVSSDEEFSEDEPEYDEEELQREIEGFIASDEDEEVRKAGKSQYRHANFVHPQDRDQKTAEAIAREIEDRHAKTYTQADDIEVDDDGGRSSIAQQSRLPTIKDPRLWMVKTQSGMEKIVASRILQKYLTRQNTPHPLSIFSVITQDHLKGYIYIEARRENHVREAIERMDGIMQFSVTMVQLDEMVQIMKVPKTKVEVKKGDWVRVKKGTYADDFAVVQDFDSVNSLAEVKIIPRIDFTNTEEEEGTNKRGRKKVISRPQARLFNPDDIVNLTGDASTVETFQDYNGENVHKWNGLNFKDGFLYKFFSVKNLNLDVKPSLEDIKNFSRVQKNQNNDDEEEDNHAKEKSELAFAQKAQQLVRKGPKVHYAKGDLVRVFEGDLKSLIGEVQTVEGDLVRIIPKHEQLSGQVLPILASQIQKYFRDGDHIKVKSGKHMGETGMIVKIHEDSATVMSDVGNKELKLLIADIQKCTDISTGQKLGEYALYDLVQLGPHDVGVIVRIDSDGAHILEENGKVRQIKLQGIRGKKDSKKSLGRDVDGNTIGKGDAIQIVDGTHMSKKGLVKHIFRFFVFVHNREIPENNGIFVVKGKQCKLRGHSQNSMMQGTNTVGRTNPTNFGTKPVYNGNRPSSRRNDTLLSKTVTITRGPWKGLAGIVRSATDSVVMIQLQSGLEKISVSRDMIREEHFEPRAVDTSSYTNDYQNPYGNQTPSGGATPFRPQTPSHYGGATPQRPSTPHHDQDSSDHEGDVHDQYSSNINEFNFMNAPTTPSAVSTPMYSDNPKTPFDNNFQTPDTFNAPMTYDAGTPMTFDPSTPGLNSVNTPSGYMHDSNASNTPLFSRLDKIVVVDGEFKGKRGVIANLIDNSEGIVKFYDNEIKILKLNCLAMDSL
jgi:transcription elongation factor SPT5